MVGFPLHRPFAFVLRRFGARIGKGCHVYAGAKIWAPWNLIMENTSKKTKGATAGRHAAPFCVTREELVLQEDGDEGIEREGFDQDQPQKAETANHAGGSRVAGDALFSQLFGEIADSSV